MSNMPAKPGSGGRSESARRRPWSLDLGQADVVLAGARNAFFVMLGVLALLWAIQIANVADGYHLTHTYGIMPHDIGALPYIVTAPFLHFSWAHLEGNSGPLFIFGFLAAYRGLGKFAAVTVLVVLTSGFAAWFFEPAGSVGAGASGVVFGYFGYIIVRGLFDRHLIDVLIGAVMALCFAYQFSVLLPHQGIGWQAHVGGVVGGIAAGWIFRDRRIARAARPAKAGAGAAVSQAGGAAGTSIEPAGRGSLTGSASQAGQPGKTGKRGKGRGKGSADDPANPRADLYKQLDDMGL